MAYEYFYGRESEKFMFYRIPKLLFQIDELKKLPIEAKVLYGMLLDRVGLSAENGWIDDKGRIFIIYTVADAAKALGCSLKKTVGIIKELEEIGLVEKKRRGMGKPNLIYVKNFLNEMSEIQLRNSKNYNSGSVDPAIQELSYLQPNNTKKTNTEMNKTDNEQSLQIRQAGSEERELYKDIIMENIGYERLVAEYPVRYELIGMIVDLMVDVMCSKEGSIRVAKEEKPIQVVKNMYSRLRFEHIAYVIRTYAESDHQIRNIKAFLQTYLYCAPIALTGIIKTDGVVH